MLIYACFIGFILIFAGHLILFARSLTTPEFFTPSKFVIEPLNRAMSWPCQVVESFVTHLFHFPCHDTTLKWVGVSPNVESFPKTSPWSGKISRMDRCTWHSGSTWRATCRGPFGSPWEPRTAASALRAPGFSPMAPRAICS